MEDEALNPEPLVFRNLGSALGEWVVGTVVGDSPRP